MTRPLRRRRRFAIVAYGAVPCGMQRGSVRSSTIDPDRELLRVLSEITARYANGRRGRAEVGRCEYSEYPDHCAVRFCIARHRCIGTVGTRCGAEPGVVIGTECSGLAVAESWRRCGRVLGVRLAAARRPATVHCRLGEWEASRAAASAQRMVLSPPSCIASPCRCRRMAAALDARQVALAFGFGRRQDWATSAPGLK